MQQQDGHGRIGVLRDNVDPIAYGIDPFDGGGNQTGAFGYLETHPAHDDDHVPSIEPDGSLQNSFYATIF